MASYSTSGSVGVRDMIYTWSRFSRATINRLIAAQLERNWEAALQRVQACEGELTSLHASQAQAVWTDFSGLADDLDAACTHRE
jgi:hypothetical protein